jgi:hypothetical protein
LPGRSSGIACRLCPVNNCLTPRTWLHLPFLDFDRISIFFSVTILRNIFVLQKNKYYTKLAIGAPTQNPPGRIQIFLAINTAPTHSPNIYAKKIWSAPMPNG